LYNLYEDYGKNIDTNISQYLKDYLNIKQVFLTGDDDFICYRKGTRNWLENTVNFTDSAKFKPLNLTVILYIYIYSNTNKMEKLSVIQKELIK
jgi:hypothetical protein